MNFQVASSNIHALFSVFSWLLQKEDLVKHPFPLLNQNIFTMPFIVHEKKIERNRRVYQVQPVTESIVS